MRVLVTGCEGQVARSLSEREYGVEFVFAGRPELELGDPASIDAVVERVRPDLVISAAAYTAVDRAEDEPELAMTINADGPGVLALSAARAGAPIIHLSTDYVFAGDLGRPYREDDAVGPLGAYGRSKLAGERAVAASGADYVILRTAWVYSPFGGNFVRSMLSLAAERDRLNIVADQFGCPTSALDIADGIMTVGRALYSGDRSGRNGIYHLAGTGEVNWANFARAIFSESAHRGGPSATVIDIPASAYPTQAVRPANSRLDCSKLEAVFGYRAPPWRESLSGVVDRLVP